MNKAIVLPIFLFFHVSCTACYADSDEIILSLEIKKRLSDRVQKPPIRELRIPGLLGVGPPLLNSADWFVNKIYLERSELLEKAIIQSYEPQAVKRYTWDVSNCSDQDLLVNKEYRYKYTLTSVLELEKTIRKEENLSGKFAVQYEFGSGKTINLTSEVGNSTSTTMIDKRIRSEEETREDSYKFNVIVPPHKRYIEEFTELVTQDYSRFSVRLVVNANTALAYSYVNYPGGDSVEVLPYEILSKRLPNDDDRSFVISGTVRNVFGVATNVKRDDSKPPECNGAPSFIREGASLPSR